jgi:hypothetical protein
MDSTGLRGKCQARLAGVDIPRPFDVREFCARLGERRGRPIALMPMSMPASSPCGLWISGEHNDYIVYEQKTTPLHQEHIILHEIGHLLCEHRTAGVLSDELIRQLFPSLDPAMVRRVFARTSYSTDEEREAEMLGSLIAQRIVRRVPVSLDSVDQQTAEILRRLESSM